MSKILVLGVTGSGKTSSLFPSDKLGIKGLNPKETFLITVTNKPLSCKGGNKLYPIGTPETGQRYISNSGEKIAKAMLYINEKRPEIKNIVLDDTNYIMQDYYMANAARKGYDTFKEIGMDFNYIFVAAENLRQDINFIMMAHCEEYRDSNTDSLSYRFKTVGKMVSDYLTPEGKFENVLYTKQVFNSQEKTVNKYFVTNYDGQYPAKTPAGMFDELYIPNDMSIVIEAINKYNNEL